MLSTIIFLSLIILFLSLMLNIRVTVLINFEVNSIIVVIRIFGIKILTIDIDILGLYFKINRSKKRKTINLFITKEQEYLIKQIKSSILDKLYYDRIMFQSNLNLIDPCITANTIGILNILCQIFGEAVFLKNFETEFYYKNNSDLIGKKNFITIDVKVYFTIFDMVFAIIMSFYKRGKYVKQKR